jgi:hypothetical protein
MILALGVLLLATMPEAGLSKTVLVKLTTQQVATVCGKQLASGGGHVGCTRACGKYQCDYDCTKEKGCTGQCVNCPGTDRKVLPGLRSRLVISNAVVNAGQ